MIGLWRRLTAIILLCLCLCAPALAHTPDISTGKIAVEKNHIYIVDDGFLATDLERMFQDTMAERAGVDLSAPGALESEIGRFVQRRVAMRDAQATLASANRESRRRPHEPGQRARRAAVRLQSRRRRYLLRRDAIARGAGRQGASISSPWSIRATPARPCSIPGVRRSICRSRWKRPRS